jgi:hypothetical protein
VANFSYLSEFFSPFIHNTQIWWLGRVKLLAGSEDGWVSCELTVNEEIHHSRLGEVSMQRFDLCTKRYLLDK